MYEGAVRLRAKSAQEGMPAVGSDATAEVFAGGEWRPLRGLCAADIQIRKNDIVDAILTIELAEVDLDAWPLSLRSAAIMGKVESSLDDLVPREPVG